MANMENIMKSIEEDRSKGTLELREERDSFRVTLRDQFAMAALPQVLSETTWEKIGETGQYHPHYVLVAEMSYKIADAMLTLRASNNA